MQKYNSIKRDLLKDKKTKEEYDGLKEVTKLVEKIIELRIKNNMSQKDLARMLGTKQPGIARLENAEINPTIAYLERVARVFNKRLIVEFR